LIISSTRTASFGGSEPFSMKRRRLEYEAVSTSIEKVESGLLAAARKGFSSMFLNARC
jgi:hypothetical protein